MKITEPITIGTNRDKQKIYIKRPRKEFVGIAAYQKAFASEAEEGIGCTHPNLLRYIGLEKDEQGEFIAMEYLPAQSLNRAVVEESMGLHTEKEARRIMTQLLDAVEYLHGKEMFHLDIRPENILITRRAHDVKLTGRAATYLHCQPSFFIIKEKYTAPELFSEQEVTDYKRCDIYALGKVMEYLYSFSNLSMGVQRIIRKATNENPAHRYASIDQMKKDLKQSVYINGAVTALKGMAALAILGLLYYGLKNDATTEESIHFAEEVELQRRELPPSNKAELTEHESYYVIPTPSDSILRNRNIPNEADARAAEYQQTAERIFKKEFRKRAEKVITGIYTSQNMELDDAAFQQRSLTGFGQLDKIQRELAEQYKLDPALSMRLSSEVISELTAESMKRLEKK